MVDLLACPWQRSKGVSEPSRGLARYSSKYGALCLIHKASGSASMRVFEGLIDGLQTDRPAAEVYLLDRACREWRRSGKHDWRRVLSKAFTLSLAAVHVRAHLDTGLGTHMKAVGDNGQ